MTTEEKIERLVRERAPDNPLEYVREIVRPYAIEQLNSTIMCCEDCKVESKKRIHSLCGGNIKADILVINEGIYQSQIVDEKTEYVLPLENSEEMDLIEKVTEECGANMNSYFWVNAVNCFTCVKSNNSYIFRTPNSREVTCCRHYADYAIEVLHPNLIILLGNIPLNMYVRGQSIIKAHGQWINIKGIKAMPVYSPKFLLKCLDDGTSEEMLEYYCEEFKKDFETAFSYLRKLKEERN